MAINLMKFKLNGLTIAGAAAFVAAAIGMSVPAIQAQGQRIIKIDGSSTVYPITEAVAEEFQKANKGIQVTVGVSGTGGGFKKFCRGETDISNASRPILKAEMDECAKGGIKYLELPIAYDALTVVVNNQNTWAKDLTVAELKKMWEPGAQGKINNWNQIRTGFPNAPLKLFGAGTASGTFDYFTEAIVGKSKSSRGDYTASEDDNVLVNGVSRDKNAIGYFGYAYYEANKGKIRAVAINGRKGVVLPSPQTVQNGTYQPLSRPLFIYVNAKSADKPEVKQFVEYYIKNGAKLASDVKYVALPAQAYTITMGHFTKRRVGTIFAGDEAVGLTIEELLKREAK